MRFGRGYDSGVRESGVGFYFGALGDGQMLIGGKSIRDDDAGRFVVPKDGCRRLYERESCMAEVERQRRFEPVVALFRSRLKTSMNNETRSLL